MVNASIGAILQLSASVRKSGSSGAASGLSQGMLPSPASAQAEVRTAVLAANLAGTGRRTRSPNTIVSPETSEPPISKFIECRVTKGDQLSIQCAMLAYLRPTGRVSCLATDCRD